MGVLDVALYYSCPHLVHLCELRLADLLRGHERRGKQARGAAAADVDEEGACVRVWWARAAGSGGGERLVL